MVTLTAVRPPARFGAIKIKGNQVNYFKEKSKLDEGWINGGFFVIEPEFLKYIKNDQTFLEKEPLEKVAKKKQLMAFKHTDFWQCMDTKRDKENLEKIKKSPELFKIEFRRLVMLLKKESAEDKDWEVFKSYFSEVHNNFDQKIKSMMPTKN